MDLRNKNDELVDLLIQRVNGLVNLTEYQKGQIDKLRGIARQSENKYYIDGYNDECK